MLSAGLGQSAERGRSLELDVRGRRIAVERQEVELLAGLARAVRPTRPIVLQRADERTMVRLLRDRDELPRGLAALRDAVTTS